MLWFMPWRHGHDAATRAANCATSITMLMSVGLFFSSNFEIPLLISLLVFAPMVTWAAHRNTKALKKSTQRVTRLLYADAVNDGLLNIDELPANIQEDVRVEYARSKLGKDKP